MDSVNTLFHRLKEFSDKLDPNNQFPNLPITIAVLLIIQIQEFMRNTQIKDQCNAMKLSCKADSEEHHPLSNKEKFEDIKRIAQFAVNVYRAIPVIRCLLYGDSKYEIGQSLNNPLTDQDKIYFIDEDGEGTSNEDGEEQSVEFPCLRPKFIIFSDETTKSIVLAIRGTQSPNDAICDLVCENENFLNGVTHSGILQGSKRLMNEGGEKLKEALNENPDYRLVVTGHSLGAGTAGM